MLKYTCATYCSYIFSGCAKIPCAYVCIAYVNQPIETERCSNHNFIQSCLLMT